MSRLKMSAVRSPSLKVRIPAFQAGDDGFEPLRNYCGYRTMVVRQIVALLMGRKMSGDICSALTEAERRPIPPGHPMDGYA